MKKLLLLFALVVSFAASSVAQNANRSGVFVEAGAGLFVGTPPFVKVGWKHDKLTGQKPSGPDLNLAVGYRGATSSVFAWEFKVESSFDPGEFQHTLVLALMPGFRVTTKEFFGNTSLYFGLNAGFALGSLQRIYYNYTTLSTVYESSFGDGNGISGGAKVSICAGLNITHAFYAGLYWNYNILSNQIGTVKNYEIDDQGHNIEGTRNSWGSLGIRLGYRF